MRRNQSLHLAHERHFQTDGVVSCLDRRRELMESGLEARCLDAQSLEGRSRPGSHQVVTAPHEPGLLEPSRSRRRAGPSAAVAASRGVSALCVSPAAACVPKESTRQARSVMVSGIDVNQVEDLVI